MAARNVSGPSSPTLCVPSSAAEANPDSGEDPAIPAEEPDSNRDAKRQRRNYPKALEKVEEVVIAPLTNPNFSFTFDTKFSGGGGSSSTEVTPKFGSFNLALLISDRKNPNCRQQQHEEEEEELNREPSQICCTETQITSFESVADGISNKED